MRSLVAANPRLRSSSTSSPTLQDVLGTVVGRAPPENAHIVRPA
jgi:hypothetical protein